MKVVLAGLEIGHLKIGIKYRKKTDFDKVADGYLGVYTEKSDINYVEIEAVINDDVMFELINKMTTHTDLLVHLDEGGFIKLEGYISSMKNTPIENSGSEEQLRKVSIEFSV